MIVDSSHDALGKVIKFGNPYHGKIDNGVLTLPNATTMPWPTGSRRGCTLVALPSLPVPPNPVDETASGLRWDNYALLQGKTFRYPKPSGQIQLGNYLGFNYRTSSGMTWRIFERPDFYPDNVTKKESLRLSAYPLSGGLSDLVDLATIAPPSYPATFYTGVYNIVAWVIVPNKTGTKALAHAYWVNQESANNNAVSVQHLQTYYRTKLLGIIEINVSGGDDTAPPSISSTVLYNHSDLYTETASPDLYSGAVYVHIAGTVSYVPGPPVGGSYHWQGSIEWVQGDIQPKNFFSDPGSNVTWIMCACYDDSDALIVFSERRRTWTVASQVGGGGGAGLSWVLFADGGIPGTPVGVMSTLENITDSYMECSIERNGSVVCSGQFHHRQQGALEYQWTYPSANGTAIGFYEEDRSIQFDMTLTSSSEDRSEAVFVYLRGEVLSMSTAALAFRAKDAPYNSPPESTNELIPTRNSAIFAVAGPKTQNTFGKSAMVIQNSAENEGDPPFSGSLYDRPGVIVPYVNVHPITGEFAYGYSSGFV